jgi:hypothetical protein
VGLLGEIVMGVNAFVLMEQKTGSWFWEYPLSRRAGNGVQKEVMDGSCLGLGIFIVARRRKPGCPGASRF